jgi:hypothetical protein
VEKMMEMWMMVKNTLMFLKAANPNKQAMNIQE